MNDDEQKKPLSEGFADEFKEEIQQATEALAAQIAFWKEWIPGGLRRRKRYRTQGHGKRKGIRRRKNKVARLARRANRRPKRKHRRNK